MEHSLILVGYGNVGKAFTNLLIRKRSELKEKFDLSFIVTGIATGRHGAAIDPNGLDLEQALEASHHSLNSLTKVPVPNNILDFIRACPGDALLENTPVNHQTGQPAAEHLRCALENGMHAITANKGPVAHAYHALRDLAASKGKRFLFESAVMDGAPIFSLFREPLPAIQVVSFHGILNSCTNLLLCRMEDGETFEQAVAYAQSIGITETDPSADIDGWDAAIKVSALASVIMNVPLKPQDVEREGIRSLSPAMIADAAEAGERWKLVCRAWWENQQLHGKVAPERVKPGSPLFGVNGTSSYIEFETDTLPGLGIVEGNPSPDTTAYGLLSDTINAFR